ncbi:MAG: GNAT family N-acetyltransferase [Myxococcota bacterium]
MTDVHSIRAATLEDLPTLETIAVAAGMFTPEDVGMLSEQFRAAGEDDHWLVLEADGTVVGGVYYAPEPFADRMWNLYFIAVSPQQQGHGYGQKLIRFVEDTLAGRGSDVARTMIIHTSSTDAYVGSRAFYTRLGYAEEARIRQFYGPDDHQVVFWKSLVPDA